MKLRIATKLEKLILFTFVFPNHSEQYTSAVNHILGLSWQPVGDDDKVAADHWTSENDILYGDYFCPSVLLPDRNRSDTLMKKLLSEHSENKEAPSAPEYLELVDAGIRVKSPGKVGITHLKDKG